MHFTIPPVVHKNYNVFTYLSTLIIFFISIHSNGYDMISHCGFDLNFSNDQCCLATFHMLCWTFVDHFGEVLKALAQIKKLCYLFYCCWLGRVLYIFGVLTSYQIYDLQISFPISFVAFNFFVYFLWCMEVLSFI